MPGTIIESVLTNKLDTVFLIKWLNNESIEEAPEDCILLCCDKNEFVTYFLSYIRSQTDSILQTNNNALQLLPLTTPEKIVAHRKHRRSVSDPTSDTDRTIDNLNIKADHQISHESPNRDRKRSGRKVRTKLFTEDKSKDIPTSPDELKLSSGINRLVISSTPVKNGYKNEYPTLLTSPVTPNFRTFKDSYERCDTPRLSHKHSRSQEKSISLGDFLINAQPKSNKKKHKHVKNTSDDNDIETKVDLDISNSEMFPEIGARKSSSLRSETRRIKPTNLDKSSGQKSFSLNNFNAEHFQQSSPLALEENLAFKHQKIEPKELSKSFETERNILKQERHKLMEKFNILNTSSSPKLVTTPQTKITHKEYADIKKGCVVVDVNKVQFKERLDILIEIYDTILKNNLVLSINSEIYFLISILVSKQFEQCHKKTEIDEDNISEYLLKSIHNSTYFAVKSLWFQRTILEVILDKYSLRILGENKKVRSFYPELAKFLLNSYGLKVESEINQDKSKAISENRVSNGVICFNFETDNADNFPSLLSFQNFKKQRDMFYEILRWYQDTQTSGSSRTSFKARIKTLISTGPTAANHAHLAALFTAHMIAECLPPTSQESKISKLNRRLTCPAAPESHRLPQFTAKEMFYKEFIMYAENENFRVHLRDALATEIITLDSSTIASESSNESDISREFLQLSKKLCLLSKFLGYLTSLPYSQAPTDFTTKTGVLVLTKAQREINYTAPKEKVLENNLALRKYSQPCIDIRGILINSDENGRLCITLPWIVHYLSMLDYTTLRLTYYQNLLKLLFNIYEMKLKMNPISLLKKNTVIFLKSMLGWLFDLPHFPREFFYEGKSCNVSVASENTIDYYDLIDESVLFELCPFLKDVNVLLLTCKISNDQKVSSFRHITPVSLSLNTEDRIRNKERELQTRLEEEFLKTQPSSTRRVLELVMERVTSGAVKELTAQLLGDFRIKARDKACNLITSKNGEDNETLHKYLDAMYNSELQQLRSEALALGTASIKRRAGAALAALLPLAPAPLLSLAVKGCVNRLNKWLNDNWNTTSVLCKGLKQEIKALLAAGEAAAVAEPQPVDLATMLLPDDKFNAIHVSAASAVINLKEHICLMLDYEEVPDPTSLLETCALACSPANLFSRPPTQRALLHLSVDYCIVYVSRNPEQVNEAFLNKLHAIWNTCCPDRKKQSPPELLLPERRADLSPQFRNFEDDERALTPVSDEDSPDQKTDVTTSSTNAEKVVVVIDTSSAVDTKNVSIEQPKTDRQEESNYLLSFFDRILCPRNIVLLSESKSKASLVWEGLATVLVFLLKNDYLSEDSLTEQCLAVYRQDWPQNILESLSTCMKSVSSRWSRSSTGKFTLFLDFLAEYCGDMDYEPID
ncbi:codanin-1 [Battus philenor]|uniref:codanin-1 n=1 Tax=Battus philenor TaxID=42288 RepID=UPI0035D0E4EC